MEKFCLKWNDFQTTVSQSFGIFRKEEDFFDVTLVSDDQVQIKAHKLVISACSNFFKSILRSNPHSHPLIFMNGMSSVNLNFILDYIYHGEVQIYQEQLDSFLDAAQKLQIAGLLQEKNSNELIEEPFYKNEEESEITTDNKNVEEIDIDHGTYEIETPKNLIKANNKIKVNYSLDTQNQSNVDQKVKELLVRKDGGINGELECTVCGKIGTDIRNMRRHAETHIEGLSYSCNICDKSFRSKNSLGCHKSTYHR